MLARILSVLVTGLLTLVGAEPESQIRAERSIAKTLRFAGAGPHTLDVRTIHGSISVSGYDGADVQIEAREMIEADTDEDRAAAERDVVLQTSDSAATIEAVVHDSGRPACARDIREGWPAWWDRPRHNVRFDFTIRVPRDSRLRLCTISGGEVRVEGTAGDFDIENVNGRITLERMRGSGRAVTVNGRVTASFAEPPRDASLFKTVNGQIVATFPSGLSADLRMKTFNGGLFTDFDGEVQKTMPIAERRGGKFVYRSNRFTTVRVGRGGPELTFDTFNGDVRVLRAAG